MTAAVWDPVKLTVRWWKGRLPRAGDGLETSTGRRYLILKVVRRKNDGYRRPACRIAVLECLVLPKGEPISGRVFDWQWAQRTRARTGDTIWRRPVVIPRLR